VCRQYDACRHYDPWEPTPLNAKGSSAPAEAEEEEEVLEDLSLRVSLGLSGDDLCPVRCSALTSVVDLKGLVALASGRSGPWKVVSGHKLLKDEETLQASCVKTGATLTMVYVPGFCFFQGPSPFCSRSHTLSLDHLMVRSNSSWGCTLLSPPLTKDVAFAHVTFRVHRGPYWGSNGIYIGITPGDHNIVGCQAACGASSTFMYRLRDGDKRVCGRWYKFNRRCKAGSNSRGSYKEGDEISLEFDRARRSLRVFDAKGPCDHPLTEDLPTGQTLYFCVDTCEAAQGATIISSCFSKAHVKEAAPYVSLLEGAANRVDTVAELRLARGPAYQSSPTHTVSEDQLVLLCNSNWGCTLLLPPVTHEVGTARVTFRVHCSSNWGSNGIYLGITAADHDIARGRMACGAATSYMYRLRDGDRRVGGRWLRFNRRCIRGRGSMGAYKDGDEITLDYNRLRRSLRVSDTLGFNNQPLSENLFMDRRYYFCVDTSEADQGVTIVASCFIQTP